MPRTLVLDGPRKLRLSDQPTRPLRPGEIRLRAMLSGISHGTELSLYRGTSAFTDKVFDRGLRAFVEPPAGSAATYPVTLGYEMVGKVTEVAPDVIRAIAAHGHEVGAHGYCHESAYMEGDAERRHLRVPDSGQRNGRQSHAGHRLSPHRHGEAL